MAWLALALDLVPVLDLTQKHFALDLHPRLSVFIRGQKKQSRRIMRCMIQRDPAVQAADPTALLPRKRLQVRERRMNRRARHQYPTLRIQHSAQDRNERRRIHGAQLHLPELPQTPRQNRRLGTNDSSLAHYSLPLRPAVTGPSAISRSSHFPTATKATAVPSRKKRAPTHIFCKSPQNPRPKLSNHAPVSAQPCKNVRRI